MEKSAKTWTEQASKLRETARGLEAGKERDELLNRADQLDAAIEMTELLSVRVPRKYR
jgi:hypothetical protein